jgi:hypothetical protein
MDFSAAPTATKKRHRPVERSSAQESGKRKLIRFPLSDFRFS